MLRLSLSCALAVACSGPARAPAPPAPAVPAADPVGPRRDAIAAAVRPYLDAELVAGVVVGISDAGRREIYGFGAGPGGAPPDGRTLFELGGVTRIYTGLLLADAIQRREVELDAPLADLLPPGVTAPTRDKAPITLRHLALDSAGLPVLPPSLTAAPSADPFAGYDEEALYRDLARTELLFAPGARIASSIYGTGLLGFALGRKAGVGYRRAVEARLLAPLELRDTFFAVPPAAAARRATGTDEELAPVPRWTWDALAGAGGLTSTVRDQLALLEAELDAAAGGKALPLRNQMRLTQEPQLESSSDNLGLGWRIEPDGRFSYAAGTSGFRAFLGFDPKTKRAVVVLASTASPLVERLGRSLYGALDDPPAAPWVAPTPEQLATYAGTYDLGGQRLKVIAAGRRLYLEGEGAPRVRLAPVSGHEFWIESLQSVAFFQKDGDKIARVVFGVGTRQLVAPRVP